MQVVTQIGTSRDFQLKQAILIYEDQVAQREKFATVHQVTLQAPDQQASLGPGALLTTSFLDRLSHGLQRAPRAMLLPENVLAYTSDLLVWWTPPRQHRMFFSHGVEDRQAINGGICPHPALVWKVERGCLFLRAISDPARPKAETRLMVAPYWNTEASRGDVCEGDMPRPRETDVTNILEWEEGFFNSRFTHPSGIGKLTAHSAGFIGLWTELAGTAQFPTRYLVECRQTLLQFIEER
jgi:PRTRC genetic system protein B